MRLLASKTTRAAGVGRKLTALGLGLLALSSAGHPPAAGAAPADAITLIVPNNTTIPESDEYATQVLAHPWDMSTPDQLGLLVHLTPPVVANGIWSSQSSVAGGANINLIDSTFPRTIAYIGQRVGPNYPVDTHRFTHLRFRMYSSVASNAIVWWFTQAGAQGNSNFSATTPGWHTYDLDLAATGGGASGQAWTAGNWTGVRLDPIVATAPAGVSIQLDWVRLTPANGSTLNVTWRASGNSPVSLYLDTDQDPNDGTEALIASNLAAGTGGYSWSGIGLAPGTYYVRAVMGSSSSYSGPLVVNAAPVLNVTAPGPSSGDDFAQMRLGKAWTMDSPSDLQASSNLTHVSTGPAGLRASSPIGADGHADPELWFLNDDQAQMIDASRYHYLTYQMYIQAPNASVNGQYPQCNLGPRTLWDQPGVNWQQTEGHVHYYNRWQPVALDLRTALLVPGYDATGWTGSIRTFRIDPFEEDGPFGSGVAPEFFQLSNVRLTADPRVAPGGTTTIAWTPGQGSPNATVTLSYNSSPIGQGTTFASVPYNAGGYIWHVPATLQGAYYITAVAADGLNSFSQTSAIPLQVNCASGCGQALADVPPTQPFYPYITNLTNKGVVEAYGDNTFQPYSNATRGLLARWVVLAHGLAINTAGGPHFSDVPLMDPLYPYIETAYNSGIVSGYADGTFHPYVTVTRGQMSKLIALAPGLAPYTGAGQDFADVPLGSAFYLYVETLAAAHLVSGYTCGGPGEACDAANRPYFRWANPNTRGQLAKVISNALPPGAR